MNFKPFFIHYNRAVRKSDSSRMRHIPRGFTAYITPSKEERKLNVQIAWCSAADEFVKRQGRIFAEQAEIKTINPRDLPQLLGDAACKVDDCDKCWSEFSYLYVLKYVV